MAVDEDAASSLPRGAPVFFRAGRYRKPTSGRCGQRRMQPPGRPEGRVGEVVEQTYPRTFHTATVFKGTGECVILCHAYPLSGIDTPVLTRGEWREVRHYGITTLGAALFNVWD
jgi:hypothetical protein